MRIKWRIRSKTDRFQLFVEKNKKITERGLTGMAKAGYDFNVAQRNSYNYALFSALYDTG